MAGLIRVLVADDEQLVRLGLTMVLGADPDIEVVAEAADGRGAVAAARSARPDVVLMDIRMAGPADGLAATGELRSWPDGPAVVVLTTFDTDEHILAALRLGANGFLLKDTPPAEIVTAVRRVAAGESTLSPRVVSWLIARVAQGGAGGQDRIDRARAALAGLSPRERAVADAIGSGASNAEIGAELHLSTATVKAYVSRILDKLECGNRVQVAIMVHEAGGGDRGDRREQG